MCYAKPGPRCAYHSKASMKAARAAIRNAETPEEKTAARDALYQAARDYDATPTGQKELVERLKTEEDPKKRQAIQDRIDVGMLRREEALTAYEDMKRDEEDASGVALTPEERLARNLAMHRKKMERWDARSAQLDAAHDFSGISPSQWFDKKTLVFDLETTGVDPHDARIVTASVLEVYGDPFRPERIVTREWTVDPGVEIPAGAAAIHGVSNEEATRVGIDSKTAIREVTEILAREQRAGNPIVGYNVSYDFTCLDAEAERHGVERMKNEELIIIDPLVIDYAQEPFRGGNRKLDRISGVYNIVLDNAHNSSADCLATAQVANRMAKHYFSDMRIAPETLMSMQRNWQKRWADERNERATARGRDASYETLVGIRPKREVPPSAPEVTQAAA